MEESFDWVSLDSDEKVEWSGKPRIVSIIPSIVIGIFLLPFAGLGLVVMIASYLQIKNTDFVVTNQGLYQKQGVLSRSVQKIGFDKVQNISFNQGVLGNYFGYGNVAISTAGGSGVEMSFNSIENPKEVQELINRHIRSGDEDRRTERDIMLEMLEELKEIRKTL